MAGHAGAGRPAGGNLQDWARRARYACLAAAAREAGYDTIVTAHHQDDQAETFLLRLARGSGVYGLAAMPEAGTFEGLALVRPLLDVPRAELARIAAESGLATVADPSNEDLRFDRVRMRRLMPALAESGLTAPASRRDGRAPRPRCGGARPLCRGASQGALPRRCASGAWPARRRQSPKRRKRSACALWRCSSRRSAGPTTRRRSTRSRRSAARSWRRPRARGFRRTLHGVVVSLADGEIAARREWGRAGLSEMAAPPGATLVWDRRFRVEVPRLSAGLSIGPLGRSPRRLRSAAADAGDDPRLAGALRGRLAGRRSRRPFLPLTMPARSPHLAAECLVGSRLGLAYRRGRTRN